MINRKDLEGSSRGLIDVLFMYLSEVTEEDHAIGKYILHVNTVQAPVG
jgi:hypothetical protein